MTDEYAAFLALEQELDDLQRKINAALGASQTPGAPSCHFWCRGNPWNKDGYNFRNGRDGILFLSATKEELLSKMQEYYQSIITIM